MQTEHGLNNKYWRLDHREHSLVHKIIRATVKIAAAMYKKFIHFVVKVFQIFCSENK